MCFTCDFWCEREKSGAGMWARKRVERSWHWCSKRQGFQFHYWGDLCTASFAASFEKSTSTNVVVMVSFVPACMKESLWIAVNLRLQRRSVCKRRPPKLHSRLQWCCMWEMTWGQGISGGPNESFANLYTEGEEMTKGKKNAVFLKLCPAVTEFHFVEHPSFFLLLL